MSELGTHPCNPTLVIADTRARDRDVPYVSDSVASKRNKAHPLLFECCQRQDPPILLFELWMHPVRSCHF
eukprot:1659320-Prymnesium_polylepis.2